MKHYPTIRKYKLWMLLLFGGVSIATSTGWGVIETSEARYAEISREMFVSNDWTHPTLMGIYHYHKPPLTYWITSLGYFLFGVGPFGARFFLQISVILQILLLHQIVLLLLKDERVAFLTCIVYASMNLVLASMRGLTTDCYLNTFVLLSILSWIEWRSGGKTAWLYATAAALALGFLTKGPLIFIVPVSFFIGFNRLMPISPISRHHILAFLLFVVIGLSWYGILVVDNPNLLSYFLKRQTYERLVQADVFGRTEPFWYYIVYLPVILLPWSGIYLFSLFSDKVVSPINRINVFWIGLPLLFFSAASSKLVLYVLPVSAGIAISVAYSIHSYQHRFHEWFVLCLYLLEWLALALLKWIDISLSITIVMLSIALIAMVLLVSVRNIVPASRENRISMYAIASTLLLLVYVALFMNNNQLRVNSTVPLSDWITKKSLQDRQVVIYNALLPSMEFQLEKKLLTIDAGDRHLQREVGFQRNERWKNELMDIRDPVQRDSVRERLMTPTVIIAKGDLKNEDEWIRQYVPGRHVTCKWTIYY